MPNHPYLTAMLASFMVWLLISLPNFGRGNSMPIVKDPPSATRSLFPERTYESLPKETHQPSSSATEIANAERIAIKVQGYAELSGEYRVGADGVISFPVIGRIPIRGMMPSELESVLAERVSQVTGREAYVTVEISEYRGIIVAGYVARPGTFSWRPGMTVLQALALAGGLFRAINDGGSGLGDDSAIMRLQKAIADQKRHLAAMARLEAERGDLKEIEMPAKLIELVGNEFAAEVIKGENSALVGRRAAAEAKRAALARAIEVANRELVGLAEQAERLKIQLSARRSYKNKIDDLQGKGIVRAERSMDEFSRVSELEERNAMISVSIARVQGTLAGLERDRINLEYDRRTEIDHEMIKVGREIAQLDIDIDAERIKYRKAHGNDPPMSLIFSQTTRKVAESYKIIRQSGKNTSTLKSDQLSEMNPGDMLFVALE